jgi:hypothetical protein
MKLITKIEAVLDLKSILSKSSGTITRHITTFVGADNEDLPEIMNAVREARDLLRNDADMTLRLIKVRPEKEKEYKQAWASAAEKQMINVYSLIKEALAKEGRPLTFSPEGDLMTAEEIVDWATPAPVQNPHPGEPLIHDEEPEAPGPEAETPKVDPKEPALI